jgi:hypothetical protein
MPSRPSMEHNCIKMFMSVINKLERISLHYLPAKSDFQPID